MFWEALGYTRFCEVILRDAFALEVSIDGDFSAVSLEGRPLAERVPLTLDLKHRHDFAFAVIFAKPPLIETRFVHSHASYAVRLGILYDRSERLTWP